MTKTKSIAMFSDRPDGTDKNLYPEWNELLPSEWAWEFVRRNPEYRVDHAARLQEPIDPLNFDKALTNERSPEMYASAKKWGFFFQPPPNATAYEISYENGERKLIRKGSPLSSNGNPIVYGGPNPGGIFSSFHSHKHVLATNETTVLVQFDLSKSLDTQWVFAKDYLQEKKEKLGFRAGRNKGEGTPQLRRLPHLLRVLDAEHSDNLNEIFNYEDSSELGVKTKDRQTAKSLMETKYKDLPEQDAKDEFKNLLKVPPQGFYQSRKK